MCLYLIISVIFLGIGSLVILNCEKQASEIPMYCNVCGGKVKYMRTQVDKACSKTGKPIIQKTFFKCENYGDWYTDGHFFGSRREKFSVASNASDNQRH